MIAIKVGSNLTLEFHLNEPVMISEAKHRIDEVVSLQADGDELEYILFNFVLTNYRKGSKHLIWFGDEAKFILANW